RSRWRGTYVDSSAQSQDHCGPHKERFKVGWFNSGRLLPKSSAAAASAIFLLGAFHQNGQVGENGPISSTPIRRRVNLAKRINNCLGGRNQALCQVRLNASELSGNLVLKRGKLVPA